MARYEFAVLEQPPQPGVKSAPGLAKLASLLERAAKEGKWIMLYGL